MSNLDDTVYLLDARYTHHLCQMDVIGGMVWNEKASLPVAFDCSSVRVTSARSQLYASGGYNDIVCAWYIPYTDIWCPGKEPLDIHMLGALVYHNDKLLLLGGKYSDDIEEYNIDDDTWTVQLQDDFTKFLLPLCTGAGHATTVVINNTGDTWKHLWHVMKRSFFMTNRTKMRLNYSL